LQASRKEDQDMQSLAERMEGLVRQLRDLSIDMHMVPVNTLFSGFRRMVRDLAAELGKEVSLELKGTDTELDKNVIEALKDPLLHIIRNSIDHGIESAEERRQAGKPEKGTVTLSAHYSGAHVAIDVLDDGKGLDAERILAKATERGVIGAEDSLSDSEALQLIFAPGFSTSETATSVSGRGVGMDVVKQNIEKLGGTVGLESERGSGTRISIRIPLTLAIVEGLLAEIGGGYYMINLSYIVECLDYRNLDGDTTQNLVDFRGELVPFVDLNRFFGLDGDGSAQASGGSDAGTEAEAAREADGGAQGNGDSDVDAQAAVTTMAGPGGMSAAAATIDKQLVVVAFEGYKIGLLVDRIYDKYQTVIKSLGKVYERVDGISGAVILGDGTPALMLDVDRLVRLTATDLDHRQGSNGNGRTRS
jgi:two-component system chemotaxis sensor kinase CheA